MPTTIALAQYFTARDDRRERVVAYGSRLLDKTERKYCVTHRELLAVIVFTKHFWPYLLERHFTLRTNHGSLQWLYNFHEPEGQLAHWFESLQEINFTIVHCKGKVHNNVDALSWVPCQQCGRIQPLLGGIVVANTTIGGETAQLQSKDTMLQLIKTIHPLHNYREGRTTFITALELKDDVLCCTK